MRNFKWFSEVLGCALSLALLSACDPFAENSAVETAPELDYSDAASLREATGAGPLLSGSMSLEVQEDARTHAKIRSASVVMHQPAAANVFFPAAVGSLLQKGIYEPLPEEQPCGIPGFPPCPTGKTEVLGNE